MIHGGDVYTEGLLKGKKLLDFSSNINPLGVPESFKNSIDKAVESLVRYPDIEYREVKKALSEYNKVPEEYFLLGNGAAEIIDWAVSLMDRILIVVPSFAEYEIDAKKWFCQIKYSYLKEEVRSENNNCGENKISSEIHLSYDYEDILNNLDHVDGIIIGNPNNPNGCIIDKKRFKEILNFCEMTKKFVVIDEAFIEFTGNIKNSFIDEIRNYKCLIIIRALTKFFGMPGIRFGYGISSNSDVLCQIREKQNPWNINSFAEEAAKTVLKDTEYIKNTLKWIKKEREYFTNKLKEIPFIHKVYNTRANYVLCELKGIDCNELYNRCLQKDIVIRKAENYRGLDKRFVRFAIKDRESNDYFLGVLKEIEKVVK
jgi:threonine-phosphate decarboxylase